MHSRARIGTAFVERAERERERPRRAPNHPPRFILSVTKLSRARSSSFCSLTFRALRLRALRRARRDRGALYSANYASSVGVQWGNAERGGEEHLTERCTGERVERSNPENGTRIRAVVIRKSVFVRAVKVDKGRSCRSPADSFRPWGVNESFNRAEESCREGQDSSYRKLIARTRVEY